MHRAGPGGAPLCLNIGLEALPIGAKCPLQDAASLNPGAHHESHHRLEWVDDGGRQKIMKTSAAGVILNVVSAS